jgi:GDP-4-dehydro-6-deoxy-D-mannose reductase
MARILVTGVTGFAGSHLAEHLVGRGEEVHGLAHEEPPYPNLDAVASRVRIHHGDVTKAEDVSDALAQSGADAVIHLAGMAVPTAATADPIAAVRVNVLGTATVVKALEDHPRTALVLASSADVYGAPDRVPVDEDAPLRPGNVYSATKIAAEGIARDFAARREGAVVILRPANQNGPRQHPGLAASAFARQIAQAEAGLAEPVVKHGRLDAQRDFLDVRDMARAYAAASALRESGTFNVGSGRSIAIAEILDTLLALARIPIRAELDPSRVRGGEPARVALDATRFRQKTGWSPRIALSDSLRDTLDHWRSVCARQGARV